MNKLFLILFFSLAASSAAQYPPAAGKPGSSALHKDSGMFVSWVKSCNIARGFQDISDTSLGLASTGNNLSPVGKAGVNGTLSLGDGGSVTCEFDTKIKNGPGYDFAVFENSFADTFLELAFVEVSSDGQNFYRFPSHSLTQDSVQVGSFGRVDAEHINNLAGKYRALFGTPFDLEELQHILSLDIDAVTHVRIVDVVGSINDSFARIDTAGHKVNDPWPTPFPSGGFDLDAIGLIHTTATTDHTLPELQISLFPNPATEEIRFSGIPECSFMYSIYSSMGTIVGSGIQDSKQGISLKEVSAGKYFLQVEIQGLRYLFSFIRN